MQDFNHSKDKKNKKLHYELTREYFRKDAAEKSGYYSAKDAEEIKYNMQQREMWEIYISNLDEILQNNSEITSVIDVGCGMGQFTLELANRHVQFDKIVGIDFLKETINIPRENPNIFRNVDFIRGDLLDMPFKNKSFDITFCLNTLHHIHKLDFKKAIEELARITKKYLVLEIRNKKNVFDFLYNYVILPNFYRELTIYSCSVSEISSLTKKYNFQLEFMGGESTISWACRRLVLAYKLV